MKYDYTVIQDGITYNAGEEVPDMGSTRERIPTMSTMEHSSTLLLKVLTFKTSTIILRNTMVMSRLKCRLTLNV